MISFYHVYKSYQKDVPVLVDVQFEVQRGDFVCLTGPSGSGKTTIFKLIFGAEQASEGQILVDGRNIFRLKSKQIAVLRRTMGVVFQDFKLISNRTVFDNVGVPLQILGVPKPVIDRRVHMMLRLVGLESKAKSFPRMLSGGEQQRVAIARALINDPRILLADEPTGNLDPALTIEILDLFKDIHARGTTILLATHDEKILEYCGGRNLELSKSQVVEHQEG